MSKQVHPWKRFWVPREGRFSLADDGFLVDPDSESAAFYEMDVVSFESISHFPCLVLLGEPGSGKSTALDQERSAVEADLATTADRFIYEDLRAFQTDYRLAQKVFGHPELTAWKAKASTSTLHLFLDSLDEGSLRIGNIAEVLKSELHDLPVERLRLRIACRTADWPVGLETSLREMWGDENVGVFELAPLRKADVILQANSAGLDPGRFLSTVKELDAAPLANRPITLQFLTNVFKPDKPLPRTRVDLYLQGCLHLCAEHSQTRRDSNVTRKFTAAQRLEVASRLAAVTIFSKCSAIKIGETDGDVLDEDLRLDSLIGGTEGSDSTLTEITLEAVHETVKITGLFTSRGPQRLGWAHQTYAEFLAARYLHTHPAVRGHQLLLHPDGSGKVIPQLREAAAWLAGMDVEVFRKLTQTDPETLLRSDVLSATEQDRAQLVSALLRGFETKQILYDFDLWQFLPRLANTRLHSILQPYLQETSRTAGARIAAIDIARRCGLTTLQPELITIALNRKEAEQVRIHAADAIAQLGDSVARAALKPLALDEGGNDPDDELKGYALTAMWPHTLTATELFASLTPQKRTNFSGAYQSFLKSDIVGSLKADDLVVALKWAKGHLGGHPELDPLTKLAINVIVRSIDSFGSPEVAGLAAQALVTGAESFMPPKKVMVEIRRSAEAPRLLAHALLPLLVGHRHGSLILMDLCAINSHDSPWLLDELGQTDSSGQRLLSWVIVRRSDPEDVDSFDAILQAARSNPVLNEELRPLIAPIPLGTTLAADLKAEYEQLQRYRRDVTDTVPRAPDSVAIGKVLDNPRSDAFYSVWALAEQSRGTPNVVVEPVGGWNNLNRELQARILESAQRYLITYSPLPDTGEWWKKGLMPNYALAGHAAMHLLYQKARSLLDALDERAWTVWAPIILLEPSTSEDGKAEQELIQATYDGAASAFLRVLGEIIDSDNERFGTIIVLQRIRQLWTEQIAELLRRKLTGGTLKPAAFRIVLSNLLENHDSNARRFAEELVTGSIPPKGEKRLQIVYAANVLIAETSDAAWGIVWPVVQANEAFGLEVFQQSSDVFGGLAVASKLDEDRAADLFLWLHRKRVPSAASDDGSIAPAEAFSRWHSLMLNGLANRGTTKACTAIRRISNALPHLDGVRWFLRSAEELARRNTWVPISPEELLRLGANPSARLIRNGTDLLDTVRESLDRLQTRLQGETPAATDLWNGPIEKHGRSVYWPKDEQALSDYIKRHLEQDLKKSGVIVNREVEIRHTHGGAPGERTDIYVGVAVPGEEPGVLDRVALIIEVKGMWHADVGHAMQTQLVERYMNETVILHGLYVVGWFQCAQWDPEDKRRTEDGIALSATRQRFDQQAAELSNHDLHIRAMVLNAALR